MDSRFGYDEDFYAWSQQQAEVLRGMSSRRRDLPNDLDLEQVAEEIEDMGKSELRTVLSHLRQMLSHLIELASAPNSDAVAGWKVEVLDHQELARDRFTDATRKDIDLDGVWRRACRNTEKKLAIHGERMAAMPEVCPLKLDDLLAEGAEVDELVVRIGSTDA